MGSRTAVDQKRSAAIADGVRLRAAASRLDGVVWPSRVRYGVRIDGRWYPLWTIAVDVTGDRQLSTDAARRWFEAAGYETVRFTKVATPPEAGTVASMTATNQSATSDIVVDESPTPPPAVLEKYLGEWVAMAGGSIIDHDPDLAAIALRIRDGGIRNDRLFRVPDDLSAPVPATLG